MRHRHVGKIISKMNTSTDRDWCYICPICMTEIRYMGARIVTCTHVLHVHCYHNLENHNRLYNRPMRCPICQVENITMQVVHRNVYEDDEGNIMIERE